MTLVDCVPDDISEVGHPLVHVGVGINNGCKDDLVPNFLGSTEDSLC